MLHKFKTRKFNKELNDFTSEIFSGLIMGRTGSGKSVFQDNLILNYLEQFNEEELTLFLVDTSYVEFCSYKDLERVKDNVIHTKDEIKLHLKMLANEVKFRKGALESEVYKTTGTPVFKKVLTVFDILWEIDLNDGENRRNFDYILDNGSEVNVFLIVGTQSSKDQIERDYGTYFFSNIETVIELGSKAHEKLPLGVAEVSNKDGIINSLNFDYISSEQKDKRIELLNKKD